MSFLGCGSIKGVLDQKTFKKYLIHEFYPEEPLPASNSLTPTQMKCLKSIADKLKTTHLSNIKKDPKKSNILKLLIRVGRKKIEKKMVPKTTEELGQSIARASSSETGFASEPVELPSVSEQRPKPKSRLTYKPFSHNTTIRKTGSPTSGFSSVPEGDPTIDEILEDPWVYIDWKTSKGGSTRRKTKSGRKTRRYL